MPKFVPRERKHKRRNGTGTQEVEVHVQQDGAKGRPKTEEAEPPPPRINAQKRKRLDKYIEKKLRKEENLDLLKKLAAHKVDTSLFQSSKTLGRVTETKRERIRRALNEKDAGIDVDGEQDAILFEERASLHPVVDIPVVSEEPAVVEAARAPVNFGSGLKRPLDTDETGQPIIKRRKRRAHAKTVSRLERPRVLSDEPEVDSEDELSEEDNSDSTEWAGFSDDESVSEASEESESSESGHSDDDASTASASDEDEEMDNKPQRVSAFKAWADSQRNESLGFTPSTAPTNDEAIKAAFKPRTTSPDADVVAISEAQQSVAFYRPAGSVTISRSEDIQTARLELPVVREEQKIIEAVHNYPVTVICGATGSGKTTQVPQMLLENGYAIKGMIGVTQPRRVAATSVAARVAHELGNEYGKRVAHQVRYDSTVGRDTSIKFMTDGILLRELSQDFVLSKYSVVVIDEAHERSVNTDILIGMLSRIVPLRRELSEERPEKYHPLKLIIMSATLRVTDFVMNDRLFKDDRKPPIVEVEGRQFSVTDHFSRKTSRDYLDEIVHKVSRGHRKLPQGGMLVFLTGQDEIQTVAKRLRARFSDVTANSGMSTSQRRPQRSYFETDDDEQSDSDAEITGLDDSDVEDDEFVVQDDSGEVAKPHGGTLKAHIVPLYAALPANQQSKVFEPAPDGSRMIVLATNVAETSLTIPGIRYVFDCGRSKEKRYDPSTGIQEFAIDWISKASASQRKGRAGRTGPGHCYRLYSSAIYEQYFEEHTVPEILRVPIEGTVLQLKNLEVDDVINFPFPTPPDRQQLGKAEVLLKNLGAIDANVGKVTWIGREIVGYPVNPRFGKMLLLGLRNGLFEHTVAAVAGLAVGDLFIPQPRVDNSATNGAADHSDEEDEIAKIKQMSLEAQSDAERRRQAYGRAQAKLSQWDDRADVIKLLTAIALHASQAPDACSSFSAEFLLREKGMSEVQQLRRQLHNISKDKISDSISASKTELPLLKEKEIALLKQIVAAGYVDQVAIRADLIPSVLAGRKPRRAIEVAYRTLLPSSIDIDRSASPEEQEEQKNVYVHPSSVLARLSVAEMPPYIIYSLLSRATARAVGERPKRVRMHPLTTVGPKQLAALAEGTSLLELGKPMGKIEDRDAGKRRECWVPVSLRDPGAKGSAAWPLGAWKVVQARKNGKDWVVEQVVARGAP